MSMYGRDPWGGPVELHGEAGPAPEDDDQSRNLDVDRAARSSASSRPLDEIQQSWLLAAPGDQGRKKKYVDLGCVIVSRKVFVWTLSAVVACGLFAGLVTIIVKAVPHHHRPPPPPDKYTVALQKALMFFNAQRSGPLPRDNNVPWRGNSGMTDGLSDPGYNKDLVGGYYDAGDTIKFHFPMSFAMTMLSWSAVEYRAKFEAAGELSHIREIIKWGADYILKTFNSSSDAIESVARQVGVGNTVGGSNSPNDHYCWMRPEDMDYQRLVHVCSTCSDLAAEMAAALASASIVFRDSKAYSARLVRGADTLWRFARGRHGLYSPGGSDASSFYNSTNYWDEYVWGATWMYYATGNVSYLSLATHPKLAKRAGAYWGGPDYGVMSWDNKLAGAQVLLTRLRMFISPGYPYEEILMTFHNQTNSVMCSFLPVFNSFNWTKGGLIQLNHGRSQPLQYVVNAAFLASVYSDYLEAADTPGWYCGAEFFSISALRDFARSQVNYILGENPQRISYIVGYGDRYPLEVHHRGASIPKNGFHYGCTDGWKWRDARRPNPNTIVGAMVAGPDGHDGFRDVRTIYDYTEPTLAGNAGLVAALASLSGAATGFDKKTMFSYVPPRFPTPPRQPSPGNP